MKKKLIALLLTASVFTMLVTGCASPAVNTQAASGTESGQADSQTQAKTASSIGAAEADVEKTITVMGSGTVTVAQDTAQISFDIRTKENSAEKVQTEQLNATENAIDALKDIGIEEKNIQVSNSYLYPEYYYSYTSSGDAKIGGFTETTTITVSNLDVDEVGKVIDAAVSAGVNQVNTIRYSYSDAAAAYDQALETALERAEEKAKVIADKKGVTLDGIVNVSESGDSYYASNDAKTEDETASGESGLQLLAGKTNVNASVTVTYSFK